MKNKLKLEKLKIAVLNKKKSQSILGGTDDPKSEFQGPDCPGNGHHITDSCLETC